MPLPTPDPGSSGQLGLLRPLHQSVAYQLASGYPLLSSAPTVPRKLRLAELRLSNVRDQQNPRAPDRERDGSPAPPPDALRFNC